MKKLLVVVAVAFAMIVVVVTYSQAQTTPEKATIMGEVIDVAGYAMKGARGEESAAAGTYRAEGGFPVGILENDTGTVFIAVYRNPAPASSLEPANAVLAPLMGKEVVARGRVFRTQGVTVIEIALAAEM